MEFYVEGTLVFTATVRATGTIEAERRAIKKAIRLHSYRLDSSEVSPIVKPPLKASNDRDDKERGFRRY